MAEEAKTLGATLIHYSTDYVFDGNKNEPYVESDCPKPLNIYGRRKLAGENAIQAVGGSFLILRTSWVYATWGRNFLLTIVRLAHEGKSLRVVGDQIGAPTWSRMIAEATAQIVAQLLGRRSTGGVCGVYHLTTAGHISWYGFAKAILEEYALFARLSCGEENVFDRALERLISVSSSEYLTPPTRPANSVLCNRKLRETFGITMPDWKLQLKLAVEEPPSLPSTH